MDSCSSLLDSRLATVTALSVLLFRLVWNEIRLVCAIVQFGGIPYAYNIVVPFAINYSGRVAGHLNDERGRSRPVRGKRNRFKIVSSQKARAGAVVRWKNTEGNNSSVERDRNVARSWTEKCHACGAILFSAGRSITALLRIKRKRG